MASDATHLALDDIIFPLGANLVPQPATPSIDPPTVDLETRSRSATPVPPDEHEVLAMRTRALAIRDGKGKERVDSPGNELVDMVLRLTAVLPARAQVFDQAATIRRLSQQQDFLLQRISDERASWDAERDGMHRVSEALIAQANIASHNLYKEQENSKKPAIFESENTSLRQKLADAQSRVSSLEAELAQLRPLLLMQPSSIALSKGLTLQPGKPRKKEGGGNNENRSYYRVREEKVPIPKSRKKKAAAYFKHAPTVADARSEHLLLAARKIGKERASMVSQAMYRTAEPQASSVVQSHESVWHSQSRGDDSRPMMSPAVWTSQQHIQQSGQAGQGVQQIGQHQGQQPVTSGASKGAQNPPLPHYGSPGMTYAQAQQYFMPSGPVGRPGAAMPAHAFYHAPTRGYIPGPAWPYYSPGPYTFGQPIAIQNTSPNARASPVRPANSPPVAGPSRTPAPSTPQGSSAPPSSQNTNEKDSPSNHIQLPSNETQREKGQKTPQSKSAATTSTPKNPPTPMDSLLSAARTVFSPDSNNGDRAIDGGESPSPKKRRRVDQQHGQAAAQSSERSLAVSEAAVSPERRASALDVLADQAAGVVPSSPRSRSGSVNLDAETPLLTENKQPGPAPVHQPRPRKRKQPGGTTVNMESRTSAGEAAAAGILPAPIGRKGKRSARASSAASASRASLKALAPPKTVQRAASEEHTPSAAPTSSQVSSDSFRLRPVQAGAFARSDVVPSRSSSLPRAGASASRTGAASGAGRGRQPNGRAATPLGPTLTRVPAGQARATSSVDADADAEGDDVESEDDADADAQVDQLEDDAPPQGGLSAKKGKGSAQLRGSGEDVNSRRWMEILGRKDA